MKSSLIKILKCLFLTAMLAGSGYIGFNIGSVKKQIETEKNLRTYNLLNWVNTSLFAKLTPIESKEKFIKEYFFYCIEFNRTPEEKEAHELLRQKEFSEQIKEPIFRATPKECAMNILKDNSIILTEVGIDSLVSSDADLLNYESEVLLFKQKYELGTKP